jgi:hypothetical protein
MGSIRALLLAAALAGAGLGACAPAAQSREYFTATTTQSPPNPVPEGTLVTYTTTVTNVSGEAYPFAWFLPEDPRPILDMFVLGYRSDRQAPNTYISVTPSQGVCTPQATTPPSVDCTFGDLAPGASAIYISVIEARVSMENLVSIQRFGTPVLADVDTIVTPACVVPSVVGRLLASARKLLAKANCSVGAVTRKRASKRRRGRVAGQRPAAGTRLANGAPVAIVVGKR